MEQMIVVYHNVSNFPALLAENGASFELGCVVSLA